MASTTTNNRISSIDAYRGFVMLLMMGEVLNFEKVSKALPDSGFWQFLAWHQDHVAWVGCSLHDMIQPSFSFLVGVALPFSIANRMAKGESFKTMKFHAAKRAIILILLGIFLRIMHHDFLNTTFEDTLTQIGLGYFFLFLLGFKTQKVQIVSLTVILIGYFGAFAFFPVFKPSAMSDFMIVGVPADWQHNLSGFAAHWNKNTNLAWAFDRWFLNLFPRDKPFMFNSGGYVTLSFIPTLGTMILGLLAGNELKNNSLGNEKIKKFLIIGISLLAAGLLLNALNICPVVKRIWTPSWTLFSGGACFLFLSFFYWTIDILKTTKWYFAFMVVGANSIAAYLMAHTIDKYIGLSLKTVFGQDYSALFGAAYSPLIHGFLILFFEWLILFLMYKKRVFLKI